MRALALAAVVMLAAPALAGKLGGGPELGDAPPWPEAVMNLSRDVQVFVRITDDATGEPAAEVTAAKVLRVEAGLIADADMADTEISLFCEVVRLDPTGKESPPLAEGTCFEGVLSAAGPGWAPLQFDARFTPAPDDLNGTAGVGVRVFDRISEKGVNVLATYRWTGGRE